MLLFIAAMNCHFGLLGFHFVNSILDDQHYYELKRPSISFNQLRADNSAPCKFTSAKYMTAVTEIELSVEQY